MRALQVIALTRRVRAMHGPARRLPAMRALQVEGRGMVEHQDEPARRLPAMRALQVSSGDRPEEVRRPAGTETARHEGTARSSDTQHALCWRPARRLPAMRALQVAAVGLASGTSVPARRLPAMRALQGAAVHRRAYRSATRHGDCPP